MPGVPFGATQSTLTSSSGCSTDWPSQSLTRFGSPAISIDAIDTSPLAPWLGCCEVPASPSHSMKNGSCGSDWRPLTPSCFQRSSVPSGRCRLPLTAIAPQARLVRVDVVDGDDPAEPAASEQRARAHRLAEGRLVGRRVVEHLHHFEVGVVTQRKDPVAGSEARVDTSVLERFPQKIRDALHSRGQAVGARGEREVVQSHVQDCGLAAFAA